MMSALLQKKFFVVLIIFVVLLLIGSFLFLKGRLSQKENTSSPATTGSKITLPEAIEKEAEISLTSRYDKKAVILKINKISRGVTSVEYELSYEAKGGLPRGVLGKIEIKSGPASATATTGRQESILREILLGTCSKNTCIYDEGVKKVSLTLKFNRASGQSTGFSKDYEL